MKILIVDDEADIRDIMTFTIESEIEADFLYADSGEGAIDLIKNEKEIDLIFCDFNMPKGSGGDVYAFLLESEFNIPFVLCSSSLLEDYDVFNNKTKLLGQVVKPHVYEGIEAVLRKYDAWTSKEMASITPTRIDAPYLAVNLSILESIEKAPCGIFVKINDNKFVKVLVEGDEISSEFLQNHTDKKNISPLIKKECVKVFVQSLCSKIEKMLDDKSIPNEKKILDIHSVIMDTVKNLGLSEQVIRATERSIDFAIHVFEKNKSFQILYQHLFNDNKTYLTKHSVALAFISCGLVSKLPWDSAETRNKLAMASFFHDATIKLPDFDERNFDNSNPVIARSFEEHPHEAAQLIRSFKEMPPDVDRIILEHHEKPDGTGLPRGLSGSVIQPLSSIFIFAHDVVDIILKLEKKSELSNEIILENIDEDYYSSPNFKKILNSLKELKLFK